MTRYTKRDLRAADLLALVFVGLGFALLLVAVISSASGKGGEGSPVLWIVAGACLALGTALHLKVRELVRNKGREPEEYPGVPD